jgi:hypothetical protein
MLEDTIGAVGGAGTEVAADEGAAGGVGDVGSTGTGAGVAEGEGAGGSAEGDGEEAGASEGEGAPAEGEEGTGGAEEEEPSGGPLDPKMDEQTRKDIAALKKTNPELAKKWGSDHFRRKAYDEEFPGGVNEARQIKATFEALGGQEGIDGLQTEVDDYRNEIKQFSEGDPALLTSLHEANPESFTQAITNGIDLLAQKNPELFEKAILPGMVARLEKAGMFNSLKQLADFIKEGKGQEAYDLTGQISAWLDKAKGMASKQLELKSKKDPERERFEQEKADFETKKHQDFEYSVANDVNRSNNLVTSKIVEPFFKQLNLKVDGRREFINALNNRIWALMKKDMPFQKAAKAILGKGDRVRAARFTHAKFSELLPEEFRKLRDAMYPNFTKGGTKVTPKAKGAAAGASANGAGAAKVNYTGGRPNRDDIDWGKTNETQFISGHAILKNGKEAKWNWADVK